MVTPEEQLGQILALLGENSKGINELKSSMSEIRAMRSEINSWKPEVDHRVHELEHAVADLGERMNRALDVLLPPAGAVPAGFVTIASASPAPREDTPPSPSAKTLDSAHLESSPHGAASGSLDHSKLGSGVVYTTAPTQQPVTGAMRSFNTFSVSVPATAVMNHDSHYYPPYIFPHHPNPFPDMEFHKFDGNNPKLWIKRCETYFDIYHIDPGLWVKLAVMRLTGSAALWFQTMETTIRSMT